MMDEFAFMIGLFIGFVVGGLASWYDARRAVRKGLVDWKKEACS
jgi:hypothetical protein